MCWRPATDADTDTNAEPKSDANTDADSDTAAWSLHTDADDHGDTTGWFGPVRRDHGWIGIGNGRSDQHGQWLAGLHTGQCDECDGDDTCIHAWNVQSGDGDVHGAEHKSAGGLHVESYKPVQRSADQGTVLGGGEASSR
jgi:hypothetical protein